MVQLKRSDINLNQIFDKKNVFGKNGALNAFAEINVKDFLLKRTTLLTPSEVDDLMENLIKAKEKFESR